jgi:hypothetical protein
MSVETAILWAAAIATLGVYSILYRENPVSRLFEHIFVGLAAGYMLVTTWTQNLQAKWWTPMVTQGRWYWVFAPIIGLLFYFIYSRRLSWLARLVMGLFFGVAAGVFFREFFPLYSPQVWASFKPLVPGTAGYAASRGNALLGWWEVLTHNWLFVVVLLTVMSYFFFSVPHEGKGGRALGRSAMLGRWFLMIAFGAMFGNTVMARISLFIGRVYFLLGGWLGHYVPWLAHRVGGG